MRGSHAIKFVWLAVLFLSLSPILAQAQRSCDPGEVRLDCGDGPLAQASMQSQDGFGTCASNTLSQLLQAALPGHPDLSYLDIAFEDIDVGRTAMQTATESDGSATFRSAFWGSNVCAQFSQVSRRRVVCKREGSLLETRTPRVRYGLERSVEVEYLDALGTLFDTAHSSPGTFQEVWESELLPRAREIQSQAHSVCHRPLRAQFAVFSRLRNDITSLLQAQGSSQTQISEALTRVDQATDRALDRLWQDLESGVHSLQDFEAEEGRWTPQAHWNWMRPFFVAA